MREKQIMEVPEFNSHTKVCRNAWCLVSNGTRDCVHVRASRTRDVRKAAEAKGLDAILTELEALGHVCEKNPGERGGYSIDGVCMQVCVAARYDSSAWTSSVPYTGKYRLRYEGESRSQNKALPTSFPEKIDAKKFKAHAAKISEEVVYKKAIQDRKNQERDFYKETKEIAEKLNEELPSDAPYGLHVWGTNHDGRVQFELKMVLTPEKARALQLAAYEVLKV